MKTNRELHRCSVQVQSRRSHSDDVTGQRSLPRSELHQLQLCGTSGRHPLAHDPNADQLEPPRRNTTSEDQFSATWCCSTPDWSWSPGHFSRVLIAHSNWADWGLLIQTSGDSASANSTSDSAHWSKTTHLSKNLTDLRRRDEIPLGPEHVVPDVVTLKQGEGRAVRARPAAGNPPSLAPSGGGGDDEHVN